MFITSSEVISRLGGTAKAAQYTAESGTSPDTAVIDAIIAEVEGDVLSAVRSRTAVTLSETDHPHTWAMIKGRALALAVFRIAGRRGKVPDAWKAANEDTLKWLERLSTGQVNLPDDALNEQRFEGGSSPLASGRDNMAIGTRED
jgi:hypothetical protein